MLVSLHTRIEPLRLSLLLAMGLLGACGDDGGTSGTAGQTTSGNSTQAASTGTGDSTVDPTTTDATATGTGSGTTSTTDATTDTSTTSATSTTTTGESTGLTATTGDTDSSSGTTGPDPECVPLMQGGTNPPVPSGWEVCGDNLPHRVAAEVCEVPATPGTCQLNEPNMQCKTDADCTEFPFGSCQQFSVGFIACGCVYGCETDADCGDGMVCRCGGDVLGAYTRCVPSECTDDGDCGDQVCQFALSEGYDCADEVINGACTTPDDFCHNDAPCGESPCGFVDGKWQCSQLACGRPFFVDEQAVTAPTVARDDWRATISAIDAPSELRDALAAHWTRIGAAEHASVASFARHVLELLAVGAPPELVLAAQQALADEVEHARLCFALASTYAGAGVGPGPLAQAHAPGAGDLEAVVAAVIREACVGETLSALEAREAAERAEAPGLRRILRQIADDEQRHAELGWRFVRWALGRMDADQRDRAHATFAAAVEAAAAHARDLTHEPGTPELRAHGVIDAPLQGSVWLRGLQGLVMPAADALRAAA